MLKRLLDVAGAALGLILLSPVMLVVAVCVRRRMGSPAVFVQTRAGRGGRPFALYKFRSMTDERDPEGNLLPDAERLTPFGRFLRRTSLDELPQLWNVLRGDMSLVGPRPLLTQYVPLYDARQRKRLDVRPGITGWAQVNGRNALSWPAKFELDVWYVEHRSTRLDLKIILLTIKKVLMREGISAPGEDTMPPFEGNGPESGDSTPNKGA